MKKFTNVLLILLCICFVLSGCSAQGYEEIACEEYTKFKNIYFTEKEKSDTLCIRIPSKWNCKKDDNGFTIVESSKEIGSVEFFSGSRYKKNGKQVFNEEMEVADLTVTHTINKSGFGKKTKYTHNFIYRYEDSYEESKGIIVSLPYEKVHQDTVSKLINYASVNRLHFDNYTGVMQIDDHRGKILVLGNSFVGTSCIGNTLQKMCGYSTTVIAHSRGNANVDTYVYDSYILNEMRSGQYSAVLMCGFYDTINATNFSKVVDACRDSNTKLAIFPAHNEQRAAIKAASSLYDYAVLLDWKGEIDLLINSGIDKSYFCIDDYHSHSTPLAGYVGAHMAYRALFGEMPDENLKYDYVSQYQISLLGDYETTGCIYPNTAKTLYSFK